MVFMASYLIVKPHSLRLRYNQHLGLVFVCMTLFFLWFVLYPRTTIVHPRNVTFSSSEKITFYAYSRAARMTEPGSFALVEGNRAYSFYFSSLQKIPKIQLEFGSTSGAFNVEIKYFDTVIFEEEVSGEIKTLSCPSMPYRLGKKNLYQISITLQNSPEISTAAHPFRLVIIPSR